MFQLRVDHTKTEKKFRAVRNIVFEEIESTFNIQARGITLRECNTANNWENLSNPEFRNERGGWNWADLYSAYQNKPNRFEIALLSGEVLCALAYGQTSRAGSRLRLDFIESTPVRPSPLGRRALPILSAAATIFAEISGADEIWVVEPFSLLEDVYKSVGFGPRQPYHQKVIGQMRKRRLL